jgi:hypothetical protein
MRTLTRRDFIKRGTVRIGGVRLAGCRGEQIVKVTALTSTDRHDYRRIG